MQMSKMDKHQTKIDDKTDPNGPNMVFWYVLVTSVLVTSLQNGPRLAVAEETGERRRGNPPSMPWHSVGVANAWIIARAWPKK